MFDPWLSRGAAVDAVLGALEAGATLRQAAAAAAVHVATLCRWLHASPRLRSAASAAQDLARRKRYALIPDRPRVPWRKECWACGGRLVVRSVRSRWDARFWCCPACGWASWRPPALGTCGHCGSDRRLWAHSRRSIVCTGCGTREATGGCLLLTAR